MFIQVSACCLAYQFDFNKLLEIIHSRCNVTKVLNEEVIFCGLSSWPAGADAFVFAPYGSVVAWFAKLCGVSSRRRLLMSQESARIVLQEVSRDADAGGVARAGVTRRR